jgi:hypothetical protein
MSGSMKTTAVAVFLLAGVLLIPGAVLAQDIQVEITFGTEVDKETRTVTGEATTFGTDLELVYCLTRIIGYEPPATVTHAWYYEGKTMARVDLKVGSPDWRTWSSKRYLPAWTGHWEVKVLDEAGKVLASAGFDIQQ